MGSLVGENSGTSAITHFTLVHMAFGALAAHMGLDVKGHLVAHVAFELFENQTEVGKSFFVWLDPYNRRIFDKLFGIKSTQWQGDNLPNSLMDIVAAAGAHYVVFKRL